MLHHAGQALEAHVEVCGVHGARDRAVEDQVTLVGQVGLVARPCAARDPAAARPARRRVSRQPKRTTSTGSRVCSPRRSTRFGVSATTTKRRAAEITIFSRRSAPPPPLISPSRRSTSSAPSRARSSGAPAVQLHDLDAGLRRQLARALGGHRRSHAFALGQELDHRPHRAARAEADRHARLHERGRRLRGRPAGAQLPFGAHTGQHRTRRGRAPSPVRLPARLLRNVSRGRCRPRMEKI